MKLVRQLALGLSLFAIIACAWLAPLDAPASAQVDAGLKRALVSFASARALHGVLSVVQGTGFSAQPFGVGVSLTPGQLLAPVNDLVKHFSDLMLAASVAFGVQKAIILMGGYWMISLLLSVTALAWGFAYATRARRGGVPLWLSRALVVCLMVRFAIPLAVLGTDVLWHKFLAEDYAVTQQAIEGAAGQTAKLGPAAAATTDATGLLDKIRDWVGKTTDFKARFEDIKNAAERVTEQIVRLMVIFILQTLLIPLLLLWAFYGLLRSLLGMSVSKPGLRTFAP